MFRFQDLWLCIIHDCMLDTELKLMYKPPQMEQWTLLSSNLNTNGVPQKSDLVF